VGIGTTAPGAKLQIEGTVLGSSTFAYGGIGVVNYNAISDSGTATYAASDDDLYVEDILEVGSTLYVGGQQINQYWKKLAGNLSPLTADDTLSATSSAATVATFTQTNTSKLALRAGGTTDGTTLNVLGNGNVGIGTSTPGNKLEVVGNISAENYIDKDNVNYFLNPGASGISLVTAGNVGIGTTAPGAKLDINGNLKIGTIASIADNNVVLTSDSGIVKYIDTSAWDKNSSNDVTTFLGLTDTPSSYAGSANYLVRVNAGTNALEFINPSSIGGVWKRVSGNLSPFTADDTISATSSAATVATFTQTDVSKLALRAGGTTDGTTLNVLGNGNVGIGTTAPANRLVVNDLTVASAHRLFDIIGSEGHIYFESDSSYDRMKLGINSTTEPDVTRPVFFSTVGSETYARFGFTGQGKLNWGAGSTDFDTNLYRSAANTLMTDDSFMVTGNVGIGTTAPTEKLDVNGNVKATGAIVGSLTGMIKGTSGTLGAVTNKANYVTYWSDANTIS
jgi:hypothetical protein